MAERRNFCGIALSMLSGIRFIPLPVGRELTGGTCSALALRFLWRALAGTSGLPRSCVVEGI